VDWDGNLLLQPLHPAGERVTGSAEFLNFGRSTGTRRPARMSSTMGQ
jgi:hypothetical protein